MKGIAIKNWDAFQHYRDRRPPWIKLYTALLDDVTFCSLPERAQLLLMKLWLVAARVGHPLPHDTAMLARKVGVGRIDLRPLIAAGFLIEVASADASNDASTDASALDSMATLGDASTHARPRARERERERTENRDADVVILRGGEGDLSARFAEPRQREAYLSYRRAHRLPASFDAALEAVQAAHTGGQAFDWPIIGAALVEMAGAGADFRPVALRAFCRRIVGPTSTTGQGGGSREIDRSSWKSDLCPHCAAATTAAGPAERRLQIVHEPGCPNIASESVA